MRAPIRTGPCLAGGLLILLTACAPRPDHLREPDWAGLSRSCHGLLHLDVQIWSDRHHRLLPDPDLSRNVSALIEDDLARRLPGLSAVDIPSSRQAEVDQHLALFDRVAAQSVANQSSPRFARRRGRPGVSVGAGLDDLSPCPVLLVLQGYQLPTGHDDYSPQISLGAIEADSGRLVWLSVVRLAPEDDLKVVSDRGRLLDELLRGFLP